MKEIKGRGVSDGIAIGKLMFFNNSQKNIPEYEIDDIEAELLRYHQGMSLAKKKLEKIYDAASKKLSKAESEIFRTHIMILEDYQFVSTVEYYISQKRKNAEYAIQAAADKIANIFKQIDDEYLSARYTDVIDSANTLLEILMNKDSEKNVFQNDEPVIVAATDLMPSDTISFSQKNLLGFVTNNGSQNSHTVILARTMGVPSIIQIHEPLSKFNGMTAIIDGEFGKIIIDPDKSAIARYHAKQKRYNDNKLFLKNQIGLKSETKNKQKIKLSANVGTLESIEKAKSNDAEGIGLFRSEFLFMGRKSSPDEEEQAETYKKIIKSFPNHRTVICTVNGSSGKGMDYLDIPNEKNPALGFKGIRICLENSDFFKTQLKALYRASVYGRLWILLPMVSCIEEIEYVFREIEEIKAQLRSEGKQYNDNVKVGVKIETPAAAIISDEILKMADFVMIDTDNLVQYTLAMDRDNPKIQDFYQPHHPAVKRLIKLVADNAHKSSKWVSVVGEFAHEPNMTEFFLALHIDELIVPPGKVLQIKAKVRECDTSNYTKLIKDI